MYSIMFFFNDGFYIIINNIGVWLGFFLFWLVIGDNSLDFNGYMMVVNVSFDFGFFYDQEIDDLCENMQYEFSVDIINLIQVGVGGYIELNVFFLIDGVVQFNIGDILEMD